MFVRTLYDAMPGSGLPNKLRFEAHGPEPFDLAIDIVVAVCKADVFNLGPGFHGPGHTFYRKILDYNDAIAILQFVAVHVEYFRRPVVCRFRGIVRVPFVKTFRAGHQTLAGIGVFGMAFRARWKF